MPEPITLVVSLWVDPYRLDDYVEYERKAARLMAKYGGIVERVIRADGHPRDLEDAPFEIHVVQFPDAGAYDRYDADPERHALSVQRQGVILRSLVHRGHDIPPYVPAATRSESPVRDSGREERNPSEGRPSDWTTETLFDMASEEAMRLGHDYVGTEHQILALLQLDDPDIAAVLSRADADPERIRRMVEVSVRPGSPRVEFPSKLPLTSRAKRVLEFAKEAASTGGPTRIMPIHVLQGIFREERNIAAEVLRQCGVRG